MILETISDLKLTPGSAANQFANVLGYHAPGDKGGGDFYWDDTSIEDENGGTIFEVTAAATGRWKRNYSDAVNVCWFGAKGDGVTDDALSLQRALFQCLYDGTENKLIASRKRTDNKIFIPAGNYRCSRSLYVPSGTTIIGVTEPSFINSDISMLQTRSSHLLFDFSTPDDGLVITRNDGADFDKTIPRYNNAMQIVMGDDEDNVITEGDLNVGGTSGMCHGVVIKNVHIDCYGLKNGDGHLVTEGNLRYGIYANWAPMLKIENCIIENAWCGILSSGCFIANVKGNFILASVCAIQITGVANNFFGITDKNYLAYSWVTASTNAIDEIYHHNYNGLLSFDKDRCAIMANYVSTLNIDGNLSDRLQHALKANTCRGRFNANYIELSENYNVWIYGSEMSFEDNVFGSAGAVFHSINFCNVTMGIQYGASSLCMNKNDWDVNINLATPLIPAKGVWDKFVLSQQIKLSKDYDTVYLRSTNSSDLNNGLSIFFPVSTLEAALTACDIYRIKQIKILDDATYNISGYTSFYSCEEITGNAAAKPTVSRNDGTNYYIQKNKDFNPTERNSGFTSLLRFANLILDDPNTAYINYPMIIANTSVLNVEIDGCIINMRGEAGIIGNANSPSEVYATITNSVLESFSGGVLFGKGSWVSENLYLKGLKQSNNIYNGSTTQRNIIKPWFWDVQERASTQANSSAIDLAGLVADFNALLGKLKDAKIMK